MSLAPPTTRLHNPDLDPVLKSLVRLLARQVAREILAPNPKEKEVDHDNEEGTEDPAEAGDSERAE